jgi:hypothetical protein
MADGNDQNKTRLRALRRLARASAVTRVLGVIVMVCSSIAMLVACTASKSSDDRLAVGLMALVALMFGSLIWSTGAFHGAVAETLPSLLGVDRKIEWLGALLANGVLATPNEQAQGDVPRLNAPEEAIELAPPPPPPPEPERVPCPLCGGLIHPDATRCVHCMRKLSR